MRLHQPSQIASPRIAETPRLFVLSFSLYLRADRTDAQSDPTAIYTRVVQ